MSQSLPIVSSMLLHEVVPAAEAMLAFTEYSH